MKNSIAFSLLFIVIASGEASGQTTVLENNSYPKQIIAKLASPELWGRGYTRHGMEKAREFLVSEIQNIGLLPLNGNYLQPFSYPVNTFPGEINVSINGKKLTTGVDYIIASTCGSVHAKGKLTQVDGTTWASTKGEIAVSIEDKLTWSVRHEVSTRCLIQLDQARFTEVPKEYDVHFSNHLISHFKAANILGMVKGTEHPEKFIVMTAHYDHLGGMGPHAYFPGANDNASGDALLLSLAKYYVGHPQKYSMLFIFFAGEEAGLIGSKYFVEHPRVALKQIRFVTNFDMVGTGDDGIMVVNATEYQNEFSIMQKLNGENHYFATVGARGKAENSDHYWFSENGVPSFFIYTLGGIAAYHDVFDRAETLPLTKFSDLQKFMISFQNELQK